MTAAVFSKPDPDAEARFRDFVGLRWTALVRTACIVTADRQIAEDCVQEALVRVHRHWARIEADGRPEAYARRAAINSALSWRRSRKIREIAWDGVAEPEGPQPSDRLDDDLAAALRSLPPRMRAVVALRFIENLSVTETALELGCSEGTVKSAAHKGLEKLRTALGSRASFAAGQTGASGTGSPVTGSAEPGSPTAGSPGTGSPLVRELRWEGGAR